jgi:hypothetical protein
MSRRDSLTPRQRTEVANRELDVFVMRKGARRPEAHTRAEPAGHLHTAHAQAGWELARLGRRLRLPGTRFRGLTPRHRSPVSPPSCARVAPSLGICAGSVAVAGASAGLHAGRSEMPTTIRRPRRPPERRSPGRRAIGVSSVISACGGRTHTSGSSRCGELDRTVRRLRGPGRGRWPGAC